jgi:tetratricopeptide (TPR) repeat protein
MSKSARRPRQLVAALAAALLQAAAIAQPPPPGTLSSPIPRGTLDPKAPLAPLEHALRHVEQERIAAPVLERYEAGDYQAAARLGLPLLESGGGTEALRFAVANSLAWTGRYDEASTQYRALFGTAYDARARVGLANVLRWEGQAQIAEAYYQEVLRSEPKNADAIEGLALSGRDLRPALTLRAARTRDDQLARNEATLSYRQWSDDRRFRLEAGVLGARLHSAFGAWSPRGLFASAWATATPLSPQIDVSYYDADVGHDARLFGVLQVEPVKRVLKVRAGRMDWGRAAFSAGATADGLTARTVGAVAEANAGIAKLRARLDYYDVSDGNNVVDGEAQLTPFWQPLPWRLNWFGGVYVREADREDPRYWSPAHTYGVAFVGVQRTWSFDNAELSASLRRGLALSSSAGDSWSGGAGGQVWVRPGLAVGVEGWVVDAPRPGAYRLHHVGAYLQRLL